MYIYICIYVCVASRDDYWMTLPAGRRMDGTIHVGTIQGTVAHAVYRLRSLPATEYDRRLADHDQHGHRRHLLCPVRRSHHHTHPVIRHFQETLPRKGTCTDGVASYGAPAPPPRLPAIYFVLLQFGAMQTHTRLTAVCPGLPR